MTALAVTNTFVTGASITASGHNTNFSDIVNYVNARNSGSATWDNVQSSGVFLGPAGTVAAPAYSFIGDTNTGIYSTSDDRMYFATGGVEALRITSGQTFYFPSSGSAGGPTISFLADSDTGIYNQAANGLSFVSGGVQTVQVSPAAFNPVGTGIVSSGDGSSYWNDISYKTLTDRGCLPWADEGVELQDGRVVSDCEALAAIQKHDSKITIQGLPMLDYKTFPKVSYRRAAASGVELPRDANDEPIGGQDGVEMTSMFGFMIGAIRELHGRVVSLEKK